MSGEYGKQLHFLVWYKGAIVGIISSGEAAQACAPRDRYFYLDAETRKETLPSIMCNTVFRLVTKSEDHLASRVLSTWERIAPVLWMKLYDVPVMGFETYILREGLLRKTDQGTMLVPDPEKHMRKGGTYRGAGWHFVGMTAGVHTKDIYCKWNPTYLQTFGEENLFEFIKADSSPAGYFPLTHPSKKAGDDGGRINHNGKRTGKQGR